MKHRGPERHEEHVTNIRAGVGQYPAKDHDGRQPATGSRQNDESQAGAYQAGAFRDGDANQAGKHGPQWGKRHEIRH
jgi:hypothetical protein